MIRSTLSISLAAVFAASAAVSAADYVFPSAKPPANLSTAEVKQFVTLIWDDNGYSGKKFTQYEAKPNATYASGSSWVGGQINEGGWNGVKANDLNLQEGDMGMSWAAQTLAGVKVPPESPFDPAVRYTGGVRVLYHDTIWLSGGWIKSGSIPGDSASQDAWARWTAVSAVDHSRTRSNPDGSNINFTFNVISGLVVPVWPTTWTARESKFGYWVPNGKDYPDGQVLHTKIAIAWGREMQILASSGGTEFQANYILNSFNEAKAVGHEIGNHTIDHMESNSSLPKSYMLDGADNALDDVMPWGETIDEAALYGHTRGATADTMGWKINAGKIISKEAWKSAIDIGEKQLDAYMNISVEKGNCFSFRAPRLEVNSGLYYGLKEMGYQYDCGLEEGYEEDVDGTNFVWPYTMDNGTPNVYTQRINGERMFMDSTPAGLWEIPVNCFIVPAALRPGIYTKYHQISSGAGEAWTKDPAGVIADSTDWCYSANGGKITGFDFNMFILWGLTKDEFVETMKYNLDMRLTANKAPLQYGCHTDYYTPIYDNATLQNSFNINSYGLVVTKGWNTWVDRKAAVTEFVDYAVSVGAYIVSGHQLVEEMKGYQAQDRVGAKSTYPSAAWTFYQAAGSTSAQASYSGDISNAVINMAGGTEESCGFEFGASAGTFLGIDHLSLTYKSTSPLIVKLADETGKTWDALLNNVGPETQSGNIPISAFHNADKSRVPSASIVAVAIEVANMDSTNKPATVSISDFATYSGTVATVKGVRNEALLSLGAMNSRGLSFNAPVAGTYSIRVYGLNGRLMQSISSEASTAGMVRAGFSSDLAPQMYLVKITGADMRELVTKAAISSGF